MSSPPSSRKAKVHGGQLPPLFLHKDSYKVHKSPKKPAVIYVVSPKIIHAEPDEFMALVQRLTGPSSAPARSTREQSTCCRLPVKVKARPLVSAAAGLQEQSEKSWFFRGDELDAQQDGCFFNIFGQGSE